MVLMTVGLQYVCTHQSINQSINQSISQSIKTNLYSAMRRKQIRGAYMYTGCVCVCVCVQTNTSSCVQWDQDTVLTAWVSTKQIGLLLQTFAYIAVNLNSTYGLYCPVNYRFL